MSANISTYSLTSVTIDGASYNLTTPTTCPNDIYAEAGTLCVELDNSDPSFSDVVAGVPELYVFMDTPEIITTESWVGSVNTNDIVWIGDNALTVGPTITDTNVQVTGVNIPYEGATAFHKSNGLERALLFKVVDTDLRNIHVAVESDLRATNLVVFTQRADGIKA